MHISDGLLDLVILIPLWIIIGIYAIFAVIKVRRDLPEDKLPIIGVLTAMVFALQMLNFPILGGTSGHLLGFVLMAILVTPTAAFLMISVILILQAFIFFDGGILSLSANIFNMGIVPLIGYFIYWVIHRTISSKFKGDQNKLVIGLLIGTFIGAYSSIIFASLIAGIEIGLSQNFPYGMNVTIPSMLIYHALIGIGEALITTVILGFFNKFANNYIPNITEVPIWR